MTPLPRQFVIARQAFEAGPDWIAHPLGSEENGDGGWVLSHHPDLAVTRSAERLTLGHCLARDPRTGRGAGRYVEIEKGRILPDPAALLPLYYGGEGADCVVASSPALAAWALAGAPRAPEMTDPLHHRATINYVPAPGSRWTGIARLMRDQAIDLATGRMVEQPRTIAPMASYAAARAELGAQLCRFAEDLKTHIPGTIYLPLTAGLDSRTVAASFLATGLKFEAVTLKFAGKPDADIRIARAICAQAGIAHRTIELSPPQPARGAAVEALVGGAYSDWDISDLFPGDAYRYQQPGDAMIVAGCFELGWDKNNAAMAETIDFDTATGRDIWQASRHPTDAPACMGFLDDWLAWRRPRRDAMSWASQFYIDQRLGAWRASLEHGYDLLPGTALHPANNARIYDALITPDPAQCASGQLQLDVIADLAPELMRFAINPVGAKERADQTRRRIKQGLRRVIKGRWV